MEERRSPHPSDCAGLGFGPFIFLQKRKWKAMEAVEDLGELE